MKIAVVILNWNGRKLLEQFLPSVVANSAEAEVYVADNASTDDSISFLQTHFPSVRVIMNPRNYGFAQGYNEVLKHIEADVYALINSDIEVTAGWLQPIIAEFNAQKNTAIVQPKIRDYKKKHLFEYAGAAGGFIDKYGYPFCRGRIFDSIETDHGQYDDDREIFWASGACFFIRAEVFRTLKGFDADFFAHQEEIDLCWRARNKGYVVKFLHASTVYHVGGATLDQSKPQKTYLNFRNSLQMLVKNLPHQKLFPVLFCRMLLDGVAGMRFLAQGKFEHFAAVLRAHGSFYSTLSTTYKKRGSSQIGTYYSVDSIVWNYFFKGVTTFQKLFNNSLSENFKK